MLNKIFMAGLFSVISIAVQAGDFAPFGIKIGQKSSLYSSEINQPSLKKSKNILQILFCCLLK